MIYTMASGEVKSSGIIGSNELATWWEHFELMVTSIKNPDALAEAACSAKLLIPELKDVIVSHGCFADTQAKTRSLLQIIEGKVKGEPIIFHQFLAILRRLPGLSQLASQLQENYDTRMDIPLPSIPLPSADEELVTGKTDSNECSDDDDACEAASDQDSEVSNFAGMDDSLLERERLTWSLHTGGASAVTIPMAQLSVPTTVVQQSSSQMTLTINSDLVIDAEKDLGQIADSMYEWQGRIADELKLTQADVAGIKLKQPTELKLQVREALQIWKQRNGSAATYRNLIGVFERAGYQEYADTVRRIALADRKRQRNAHESEPQSKLSRIEDDRLVKFRPKLADFYSKKPEVPEGTWPPVKKTHFVNLALIKQAAINFATDYVRPTIHGSIDDIVKDKEKIDYKDAFAELEDGALVVMEGRPGCGKTTLMHKLSQDWEKKKILVSSLFFLVHFRRFSNRSDVKLPDLLLAATLDFTDEEVEEMCSYIEENSGRGVVFALDGLDEYCPASKDNLFYNLINGNRLSNCIIIVASRPAASQKFRKYATKHIEVLGFLKPQIQEYIENYFCEYPEKGQGLLRYLEHHLNVMHMCYLPLHSAMVTYLYDMEGANLPQTETEIYRHFTLWTLIRSFKKRSADPDAPFIMNDFDDLSVEDKRVFDLILKLAFNATVSSKQVFTLTEVKQQISEQLPSTNPGNDENSLGLIVIDRYFVKYGLDEIYTFLHLTFQEFLAACFVASQSDLDQTNLLKIHGSKENLAEVWKFYCGSGKCSSENFKLLLDETKHSKINRSKKKKDTCISSLLLHLHCAYESQQEEKCHQIMEIYESSIVLDNRSLNPVDMTALGYVMVTSKASVKEVAITSCHLGPEGLSAIAAVVRNHTLTIETLNFQGTMIKQDMSIELASLLSACPSIRNLNVSRCSINVNTLATISHNIPKLEFLTKLDISSNQLGKTGSAVESLLSKMPRLKTIVVHLFKDCQWYVLLKNKDHLKDIGLKFTETEQGFTACKTLELSQLGIDDKEARLIGEGLKKCAKLLYLNLGYNKIGATGAQAIAEGLKLCPNLQKIDLGGNQIGAAGAQAIAEGLKLCPNLQTIDLGSNQIGVAGAQAIADGCKLCPNLQSIDLCYNKIGDAGAQAIAEGLKLCPNLQKIDLAGNQIEAAGAQAIAEGLKLCPNLQTIDLGSNQIGDAGAQAIADGCKLCLNLQSIELGDNQIGAAGAQAIAESLKLCPNLQTIDLHNNQIEDAGAQAIVDGCKLCPNLQTIVLRNNSITDASVPHLVGLMETARKLKEFYLSVNKFTDAGRSQLEQAAEKRNNDQANYVHLSLSV